MTADPTPEALRLAAIDEIVTAWERGTVSVAKHEVLAAIADVLHGKAPTTVAIRERYCLEAARETIEAVRRLVGAGPTEATTEAVRDALGNARDQCDRDSRPGDE